MQLRQVLAAELDPWTAIDSAWNDDDLWDDGAFTGDSKPGSDDELAAAERWLEANELDDEPWIGGRDLAADLLN